MTNMPECGFFELIEYGRSNNLCMKPFCTTCGSMAFRKLCKDTIGLNNIHTMIKAVTQKELAEHKYKDWLDPLRIILHEFGYTFQEACPLMDAYNG